MKKITGLFIAMGTLAGLSSPAHSADIASTTSALRMAGTITGGQLPYTDPQFQQMVTYVQGGDYYSAAMVAVNSKYFSNYLARRLALEMMSPALDPAGITDNDATAFLIANFIGSATSANISRIWSDNATYLVNVVRNGTPTQLHILDLTSTELAALDYRSQLVRVPGQQAFDLATFVNSGNNTVQKIAIPARDVGGYVTLSDRQNDTSYAEYGTNAGTNLRYIEGIWEVSMGLSLTQVASTDAHVQLVPRFVPENNANMFQGQGQAACISCHGGGMSSLNHGYSTIADLFDYNFNGNGVGFTYNSAPSINTMKSLGSTMNNRSKVSTCNLNSFSVCNPDSQGADASQAWDVGATWSDNGTLAQMGWTGPTTGQGLNSLGAAIGKASLVYQNLTMRVINDVCPMGSMTPSDISSIAAAGQTADDLRVIVAQVASQPSCR